MPALRYINKVCPYHSLKCWANCFKGITGSPSWSSSILASWTSWRQHVQMAGSHPGPGELPPFPANVFWLFFIYLRITLHTRVEYFSSQLRSQPIILSNHRKSASRRRSIIWMFFQMGLFASTIVTFWKDGPLIWLSRIASLFFPIKLPCKPIPIFFSSYNRDSLIIGGAETFWPFRLWYFKCLPDQLYSVWSNS
jgi:hypothetical protein